MLYRIDIEYRYDVQLAIWRVTGNVPVKNMADFILSNVEDGHYHEGMGVLSINRSITSSYNDEDLQVIMSAAQRAYGRFGRNILCASVYGEQLQFGLGRMFAVKTDQSCLTFCPFYKLNDALKWLKIPEVIVIDEELTQEGSKTITFSG